MQGGRDDEIFEEMDRAGNRGNELKGGDIYGIYIYGYNEKNHAEYV